MLDTLELITIITNIKSIQRLIKTGEIKMMLIKLKFLSPTNSRGDRLKAIANQLTKTYQWDYSLDHPSNYRQAGMQLYLDIRALKGNQDMLPPVSAQIFFLKDEAFALVKTCLDN